MERSTKTAAPQAACPHRFAIGVVLLVACMILAAGGSLLLSEPVRNLIYASESSVVEHASIWLWLIVAIAIPTLLGRLTPNTIAATIACLGCAAREADWHKLFTNYSVLKVGFYFRDEFAILERVVALGVVAIVITGLVISAVAVLRQIGRHGWRAPWVRTFVLMLGLLALGKVFDRLPDLLADVGFSIWPPLRRMMTVVEEITELVLPVLLLLAVVRFARAQAILSAKAHDRSPTPQRALT